MKIRGRVFGSPEDYESLRVDGGDLYWQGKKVRLEGWERRDKIAVLAILATVIVAALVYTDQIRRNVVVLRQQLCQAGQRSFCDEDAMSHSTTKNVPGAAASSASAAVLRAP